MPGAPEAIQVEMTLSEFERMCKNTAEGFCTCETKHIEVIDLDAKESTINEIYIERRVDREAEGSQSSTSTTIANIEIGDKSNQVSFIAGIVVTLLLVGIVALAVIICYKYRHRNKTQIILRGAQTIEDVNAQT